MYDNKELTFPGILGTFDTIRCVVGVPGMMAAKAPALPEYIPEPKNNSLLLYLINLQNYL